MSAETWGIISLCGFSLAGILFVAAVLLFIVLRIPSVIGDLSGRTVAREMARMREDNAARGERKYRTGRLNRARGPLTEKVPTGSTGKTDGKKSRGSSAELATSRGTDAIGTTLLPPEETTAYLGTERLTEEAPAARDEWTVVDAVLPEDATEWLQSEDETEVLRDADATEVLQDTAEAQRNEGTTVLSQGGATDELAKKKTALTFRKTRDIVVTHDQETERN